MQALTGGTLRRDGNCVYLVNGAERTLLLLPSPTASWNAARGTIRFGDQELRFGQQVSFGGGGGETGISDSAIAAQARRSGCDTGRIWWVSPEAVKVRE